MESRRSDPPLWLRLSAYALVALVGVAPALRSGHVVGDGVDMYGTLWFYWWVQDCMEHLRNPSFTNLFFFPLGKDIFAHTGNNLVDAVFAAPFVKIFGIPGFERWYVAAMMVVNALAFHVFARGLLRSGWAAFAASLAFELNPFLLFELTCGRLTQGFLPFLPLALHYMLRLEREGGYRDAALAGLATALSAWTYWFMGWFLAFAYMWLVPYGLYHSKDRSGALKRYALAGAICGLTVAPAVVLMALAAAEHRVPGLSEGARDLFSPPPALGNNVSATLHGYLLMEREGAPMLGYWSWAGLALAGAAWGRERARWLPVALLLLVMAAGPVLPTEPEPTVLPHYMFAYYYLPFFDRLWFPYRMIVIPLTVVCLFAGMLVDRALETRAARWVPALVALWCLGTAFEQHRWGIYPFVTRDLSVPPSMRVVAREHGALIHLPFGITQPAIVWQTIHHQPLFGGMGENASLLWPDGFKDRLRNSFVRSLVNAARHPDKPDPFNANQKQRFVAEGFRWVVLHRDLVESDIHHWAYGRDLPPEERQKAGMQAADTLVGLLGDPAAIDGPMVIWDLVGGATFDESLRYAPERLALRTWESPPMPEYEEKLREAGRLPGAVEKERK